MKTKYLLLGFATLVIVATLWAGRVVWSINHQLVTLNVRNVPLAEVLRKVEWQTWKKIRAEANLNARITLRVKNKPLSYVLDRLAEQAGARWSTLYAVYVSSRAVHSLDAALRANSKIEPAGWTKVAPKPPPPDEMPPGGGERVVSNNGVTGPGPMGGQRRMMIVKKGPGGPVMFSGGGDGQMEMWSAEELVMETSLTNRIGRTDEPDQAATAEAAAEAARKVSGHWTTFLAFRKSTMGVGFRMPSNDGLGGPGGHGGSGPGAPDKPGFDPMKHNPNDRFARLTPEQRVERARQRGGFMQQNVERNIDRKAN